ncbi:LAME_0D01618g1_1 [Lachancea meyersii CBS 8951]|uniref:LAME_0D01618g1_1 n=1 Tax=Lachancea meyersii CBS 8951 TaxID=1266667 RepID=A0A1G4J6W1_9SACH|nr:LAME_0D01618g1_1 [Lachancea meyersii CBS 8951]
MDCHKHLTSSGPNIDKLRDLNENQAPKNLFSEDAFSQATTLSHHSSSTTASSLRSPLIFNNISSEATEYMRLTPVNIKNLTSPTRGPENLALVPRDESTTFTAHKDNFNLISRKLEKLLEELNVIYREIGYSNTEISDKEKLIFNHISDSITGFFEHAHQERERITKDNAVSLQVLQRILHVINDPKGTTTIPDLYTRNVVVNSSEQNPSSPKKQTSLLTRRKIISKAKNYVIKTYTPKLSTFLDSVIRLKTLAAAIEDYVPTNQDWDIQELLSVVPPLDTCSYYRGCLSSAHHDIDKTCAFIIQHRQALLSTINFNDVSDSIVERVSAVVSMFENELESRLKKALVMKKGILGLLQLLNLKPEKNLDAPTLKILKQLPDEAGALTTESGRKHSETKNLAFSNSTLEKLESVLREFKALETERRQEKQSCAHKCSQLWEKLKIPQSYIIKFESCNNDLSREAVQNYAEEYNRLQDMKKKLIKNLIQDSWTKIQELWSAMHFSNRDTAAFQEMFSTMIDRSTSLDDDEKVLETCEVEINDLEKKLAMYKPLLKLIDEFRSLQNDKLNLEKSSKDSSRLLLRNSHRILLQEEKTRKRITRHFPNVIQELIRKLQRFEEDSGRPFVVEGTRYVDIVLQQEEEILSKYPRSRVNSNFKNPATAVAVESKSTIAPRSPRKERMHPRFQPKSHRGATHRTPIRTHGTMPLKNAEHEQRSARPSYNRYMRATRMSSPIKSSETEASSTEAAHKSPSKIPTLTRSATYPKESSFFTSSLKAKPRMAMPEGLSQISVNRLNSVNNTPNIDSMNKRGKAASKSLSLSWVEKMEITEKENIIPLSLRSPVRLTDKMRSSLESPYRDADNSLYKITKSPEGKFLLNIESNATDKGGIEGEDTSMMADDDNFSNWKRERLARMNSNEGNNLDIPSSVNWETDVF